MSTLILVLLGWMLFCPIIALSLHILLKDHPIHSARYAGYLIGMAGVIVFGLLITISQTPQPQPELWIGLTPLNLVLCLLVLLVSFVVHRFSLRYMDGDRLYRRFFILLSAITLSALIMALADNLCLFWAAWSLSNGLLILLMIHKKEWHAAKQSGLLAGYTLSLGSASLLLAIIFLMLVGQTTSLVTLTQQSYPHHVVTLTVSMILLLIAALTQSGLFPFHRWLISSLNSPTPVSALMHAGLVNGGGILMVKFAPLLIQHHTVLNLLFILGAISALLGTFWKLIQPDVKKMLACSTMAQMGFMMMQGGVGLFAAAIAHLCWHGLFKSYLFLNSGSAITQPKTEPILVERSFSRMPTALLGGAIAMSTFAFVTHQPISISEAHAFVLFFALIAGSQLMLTWMDRHTTRLSLLFGFIFCAFYGLIYGASVHLIEWLIPSLSSIPSAKLFSLHWGVMLFFGILWMVFNFDLHRNRQHSKLGCWIYMNLLNSSQPSIKTITTLRNHYHY